MTGNGNREEAIERMRERGSQSELREFENGSIDFVRLIKISEDQEVKAKFSANVILLKRRERYAG